MLSEDDDDEEDVCAKEDDDDEEADVARRLLFAGSLVEVVPLAPSAPSEELPSSDSRITLTICALVASSWAT